MAQTPQTTIWSAELTVRLWGLFQDSYGCSDSPNRPCSELLTSDSFTYEGTEYKVTKVALVYTIGVPRPLRLELLFDKAIPQGWKFHVGSVQYDLSHGDNIEHLDHNNLKWDVGDKVSLKLTAPGPATGGGGSSGGGSSGGGSVGGGGGTISTTTTPTPTVPVTPQPQKPPVDQEPLEELYRETGGDGWKDNTNWESKEPLRDWYGVEANKDGRVTDLLLSDNGLSGTLPDSLEDLSELETLDLSDNPGLSGTLPLGLMNLSELGMLNIEGTGVCAPEDEEFQQWLKTVMFEGDDCSMNKGETGGGGCAVASGEGAGNARGSAALHLLLIASVLLAVSGRIWLREKRT